LGYSAVDVLFYSSDKNCSILNDAGCILLPEPYILYLENSGLRYGFSNRMENTITFKKGPEHMPTKQEFYKQSLTNTFSSMGFIPGRKSFSISDEILIFQDCRI